MKLQIITGLSGSGKTTALKIYEDLGYYAMDNVPVYLIEKFIDLNKSQKNPIEKMAVVVDFRSIEIDANLDFSLKNLKKVNEDTKIMYLYASDEVILKRYNELRRPHPLGAFGDVKDGIKKERKLLRSLKDISDQLIDTSNYNNSDLRKIIVDSGNSKDIFVVNLFSFGYKNGVNNDFDIVFDMRFVPNPFYIPKLKHLNGTDQELKDYLDKFDIIHDFKDRVYMLLKELIPNYIAQGKNSLTIAFGCTGGKHRSVYMCERMYEKMKNDDYILVKKHRDKDKW
ncbi:MAG: RNase adapter RapZ [Peptoniphilaceae bacterium]|nr:RNase adapter RapZ [Peptoniphilaceae bacterium]